MLDQNSISVSVKDLATPGTARGSSLARTPQLSSLNDRYMEPMESSDSTEITRQVEESFIRHFASQPFRAPKLFSLPDIVPLLRENAEIILQDQFTQCFESRKIKPWNWNIYLLPLWMLGVFLRYCICFPVRLVVIVVATLIFVTGMTLIHFLPIPSNWKRKAERAMVKMECLAFVASWCAVVKFHGVCPTRKANQIFVANHTSMIDMIIMESYTTFAVVGQKHAGWVGMMQSHFLKSLGCLWFNRNESKDRALVAQSIKEHISDPNNNRMLIFPEGTCVNNEYCVMFKKGAFELGATVVPIAIRYNKIFVDAFWNSRQESFTQHLFRLMTSWAVIADIWFLEPQVQRVNESSTQFADRVKAMIAKKAGLQNVHWDGYLKYLKPSKKLVEERQKILAQDLLLRSRSQMNLAGMAAASEKQEEAKNVRQRM